MPTSERDTALLVRPATIGDAEAIASIYNPFVSNTIVTFEEETVSSSEIARRIQTAASASLLWLVAERQSHIVGYAYAAKWRDRPAYRFSTEVTVYVDPQSARRGIGSLLYERLLPELRARGLHSAMGGIALPNDASIALHEKFGFTNVAHFKDVGFKLGRWIDVGYWQVML